jgi:hypothetical protein
MKIYISHSSSFDFKKELYLPLKNIFTHTSHELIFPHESSTSPFPSKQLFVRHGCDVLLAEISYPSTGQGIELGWADLCDLPIIYLIKKNINISESIKLISKKGVCYDQLTQTKEQIFALLNSYNSNE